MPQVHSPLYESIKTEGTVNPVKLTQLIADQPYEEISDLLRELNDAQFGIVSKQVDGNWIRDATSSLPLADRISHDSPVIEGNNVLLRCLSRLRAIDYAIGKKEPGADGDKIRSDLKDKFKVLVGDMLPVAQGAGADKLKAIKKLEKEFDTFLIKQLHEANLTKGCETAQDAEKLLFHYRNLSSLLAPARPMITLTYDETARVLQRETQYPVTTKTKAQVAALQALRDINPHPLKADKTGHTTSNTAVQEADSLFVDLMKRQDRALPAQSRKSHLVGAKNAFIVKNELKFDVEKASLDPTGAWHPEEGDTLWLARTGVPVYVGKGETDEEIQTHTKENLEQIRVAATEFMHPPLNLHVTCLNTDIRHENQDTMIRHLRAATSRQINAPVSMSYMPTNLVGTLHNLDVAQGVFGDGEIPPSGRAPLDQAKRIADVSDVILKAASKPGTLSVVQCASGQDRTGTAVEKATQTWMEGRYNDRARHKPVEDIQTMRAMGGNAAEITAHFLPGSQGMKKVSIIGTTFNKEATKQFYRSSANTNKKNPVANVDFLKRPSAKAVNEYRKNLAQFEIDLVQYENRSDEKEKKFYAMGKQLLLHIKTIEKEHPETLDSTSLSDLNAVLFHGAMALQRPHDEPNILKLAGLAQNVSKKASSPWKVLGTALLTFTCVALVVAGVLLAVPTGGASLLGTVVGACGLAVIAHDAVTSEKGLAKDINNFRSALHGIREEHVHQEPAEVTPLIHRLYPIIEGADEDNEDDDDASIVPKG